MQRSGVGVEQSWVRGVGGASLSRMKCSWVEWSWVECGVK